jgi:predicted helicase
MNALHNLLTHFRQSAQSEREKGTYFEDLTLKYFAHEPKYRDLYDWAIETMDNARYPLELLQRVITMSVETMKVVSALPKLEV